MESQEPVKKVASEVAGEPTNGSGKEAIFWATAKGYSIANFVPERKEAGSLIQAEGSLDFVDHIRVTDDPKIIKFIENSNGFKAGAIRRVASLEEAAALTAGVGAMRRIRAITSSSEESARPPRTG